MAAFAAFDFILIYPPFPGAEVNIAVVEAVGATTYDLFCYGNGVTMRLPGTPQAVAEILYFKLGAPVASTLAFGDQVYSTGTELPVTAPVGATFVGTIVGIVGMQGVVGGVLQPAFNLISVLSEGRIYSVQESALTEIPPP